MSNSSAPAINKCRNCGKTIAANTRGSLTAWLFRKIECKCLLSESAVPLKDAEQSTQKLVKQAAPELARGALIHERYEILEQIGKGGMSTVYRVSDRKNGSVFALKMIAHESADPSSFNLAKRLEHEANAAKLLSHANICSVYDFGCTPDGPSYLVMDYVAGESLEDALKGGAFSESRAISISIQIAEALIHAHSRGVVHCDLKPSNIILLRKFGGEEQIKIVDFGIARLSEQYSVDKTRLTNSNDIIGSPLYMSPEQCHGDDLDGRSDIYSLGCIMYEMLSGKTPFNGENPVQVILKHLTERVAPLEKSLGVNSNLEKLINVCLEKEARHRYFDAQTLCADLYKIRDGKKVKIISRNRRRVPVALVCTLLLCVAMGFSMFNMYQSELANPLDQARLDNYLKTFQEGESWLNKGNFRSAALKFKESSSIANISSQQKADSLRKAAFSYYASSDLNAEARAISELGSINPAPRLNAEYDSSAEPSAARPQSDLIVSALYSAYVHMQQKNWKEELIQLQNAGSFLQSKDKVEQAVLDCMSKELAELCTQLEKSGSDRSLSLARAYDLLASCYSKTNRVQDANKCLVRAASLISQYKKEELDSTARDEAARIFENCALASKHGSDEYNRFRNLSNSYRYND